MSRPESSVHIRFPERDRRPGVFYAVAEDGIELPVIDVTHPTFAVDEAEPVIRQAWERDRAEDRAWQRKPAWQRRLIFWLVRRNSVVLQNLWQSEGTFLNAMATYRMKLGPNHLGAAYTKRLDRHIAASGSILDVRLRLQRVAHLVADALEPALSTRRSATVHLIAIAGGPAMDAINALLLLHRKSPHLLERRRIRLHVLDAHDEGPKFGARALAALQGEGGPLAGLDCAFEFTRYDWNHPMALADLVAQLEPDAVAAASSEGGLFQYGSDEVITANLRVLRDHTPADFTVTGSISPVTPENLRSRRMIRIPIRHFQPDAFAALSQRAGWRVERLLEGHRTHCLRLVKA